MSFKSKNKLLRYLSAFFGNEVLLFLGSFISFPVFARIFSKEDYGIMSLIGVSVALCSHLAGFGMKDAVLRFYSSYTKKEKKIFLSSIINFFLVTSLTIIAVLLIIAVLYQRIWGTVGYYGVKLLMLASLLIIFRGLFGIISTLYRLEEKIRIVIFFDFSQRYGGLIMSISLVMVFRDLYGYYWGIVGAEGILALYMIYMARKKFSFGLIKMQYVVSSIKYGFPLSMSNISTFFLNSGDRYVVGFFLGPAAVATYSVAYNLCSYIFELIKNVFFKTFMPMVIINWNHGAIDQSQKILSLHFRLYLMVTLPAVFGLTAVGGDALTLLAGTKYKDAFFLVPVLASAIAVNGLSHVTFSGMYYKSQSRRILLITLGTAILNLILNVILLPLVGLVGAAWATGVSYLLMVLAGYAFTKTSLDISYQLLSIMKYAVCALLMFCTISFVPFSGNVGLLVKIVVGIFSYTVLILFFDMNFLRNEVMKFREVQHGT